MADAIAVEFDEATYSVAALNAAAYRVLDAASCQIEKADGRYVCRLVPKSVGKEDPESLRLRFIDCVTDESLRERLANRTEPVRNLILSLAFGSLAAPAHGKSE
jgi:His-Xaa-Ser system protein HxsD